MTVFQNFYRDKHVLVTGHTGFKGGWLSLWLRQLGAEVYGLSLAPYAAPNFYELLPPRTFAGETTGDVRERKVVAGALQRWRPQFIFHLAAQALVRRSYEDPLETFETNVLGTIRVLEAVREAGLNCPLLVITSDKCYENRETERAYGENDALGGHDVYSASKAAAEIMTAAWRRSFFQNDRRLGPVATARAGNVIAGGDYAKDRILPDCIRALRAGRAVRVRHPAAVRPWQHVLECLSGYLWLGTRLAGSGKHSEFAGAFNFGPRSSARQPVQMLVEAVLRRWPGKWVADDRAGAPHEAGLLSLSIGKAERKLGWKPCWNFDEAVTRSVVWYYQRHVNNHPDMAGFSVAQIEDYIATARRKNLPWTQPL